MSNRQELFLIQGDDPIVKLEVFDDGEPASLSNKRIEIVVKDNERVSDDNAMFVLSSEGGSPAITILNSMLGLGQADFTDNIPDAGSYWYRAYIASSSDGELNRRTFAYGPLYVIPA